MERWASGRGESGRACGSRPAEADSATSPTLIERAKHREESAWDRLAELYGPMVYIWCRQLGLHADDAADIVQEVFATVATAIAGFRGGRAGAFRAWLRTITRNKVNDHLRKNENHTPVEGGTSACQRLMQVAEHPPELDERVVEDDVEEVRRHVLEIVQVGFSEGVWAAFWRTAVDGCPAAEVAEDLGVSVDSVYQAKSRVLRRLREAYRDLELS